MHNLQKLAIDFTRNHIAETRDFRISLQHGLKYLEAHQAWGVIPPRGFIQYTLNLKEPMAITGTAELAALPKHGKTNSSSAIVINGLEFVPKFDVVDPEFRVLRWEVPSEYFFAGENTIITPLLPQSTTSILVKRVTVESA